MVAALGSGVAAVFEVIRELDRITAVLSQKAPAGDVANTTVSVFAPPSTEFTPRRTREFATGGDSKRSRPRGRKSHEDGSGTFMTEGCMRLRQISPDVFGTGRPNDLNFKIHKIAKADLRLSCSPESAELTGLMFAVLMRAAISGPGRKERGEILRRVDHRTKPSRANVAVTRAPSGSH